MYKPEEDIVPYELIEQALMLSRVPPTYKVYFDKENGSILSISNEDTQEFATSIDVEYSSIKEFFNCKKNIKDYKVIFIDHTTPTIVRKETQDVDLIIIEEVVEVDNWDSMFTIENYVLQKQWGFQLRPDQRKIFKNHNLNTFVEIFIVDKNYDYNLIRSFKIPLVEVINNDKFFVPYAVEKESENNKIMIKKFFASAGYQVLYDPKS